MNARPAAVFDTAAPVGRSIRLADVDAGELARLTLGALYFLGVNGPLDAEDIGLVDRFVWRFAVMEAQAEPGAILAFSSMPRLMAFTRAANALRPFTVPTEARRQVLGPAAVGLPYVLLVDPDPEVWLTAYAGQQATARVIAELDA
jgi:hypothetical protein